MFDIVIGILVTTGCQPCIFQLQCIIMRRPRQVANLSLTIGASNPRTRLCDSIFHPTDHVCRCNIPTYMQSCTILLQPTEASLVAQRAPFPPQQGRYQSCHQNTDYLFQTQFMVPEAGLEPARRFRARDFKSLVSTYFTTRANLLKNSFLFSLYYIGTKHLCQDFHYTLQPFLLLLCAIQD